MKIQTPHEKGDNAVDFYLRVHEEKIEGNGEDSFWFYVGENEFAAGVFDGCGGSGGRHYPAFQGKSGAYLASRIACGTVKGCHVEGIFERDLYSIPDLLKAKINNNLTMAKNMAGGTESRIISSLIKEFPTTMSLLLGMCEDNLIHVKCFWAGDSRCFFLNGDGLHQLTKDDLSNMDPMDSLSSDGVLTNAISLSTEYTIHLKAIDLHQPAILLTATDGCFSYFCTPMEFEYLLVHSMMSANSVHEWEVKITEALLQISGDDFSLVAIAVGFNCFQNLKEVFSLREKILFSEYIDKIAEKSLEEKRQLWRKYQQTYSDHLE